MSNSQNNGQQVSDPMWDKQNFNTEPLRKAIFSDCPQGMVNSIDNALHMLSSADQKYFLIKDIVTAYEDLRKLRDAIVKGGKI